MIPRPQHPHLWLAALILVFCLGCGQDEEPLEVDLSRRQELAAQRADHDLTYAYLPQYSHTVSYERHRLLVAYLAEATGLELRQVFPDTFEDHIRMVGNGEIDISFSNPLVYVQLAESGAQAFARVVEESGPDFRGQIICARDSHDLTSIEDCRGTRWIAVDPSSAGGYLFAVGLFLDAGLTREDFVEIAFAPGPGGKQEKVVLAVDAGTYDIGAIREGTLDVLAETLDLSRIRVLAETPAYPGWVYAARQGLDPERVETLSQALLALDSADPEHAAILEAACFNSVISARDSDYDPIRELLARTRDF